MISLCGRALLLGASVAWIALSGCQRPDASKRLVVIIVPSQDNPFFKAEGDAAAARAKSLG